MRLPLLAVTIALWAVSAGPAAPQTPSRIPLREEVKTEDLPLLIATNQSGLGAEAQALVPWLRAHPGPLTLRPADQRLEDAKARSIKVSPAMARTLARLNQWHGLAAPRDNPITHAQLEAGAFSDDPETQADLRGTIATILRGNGHAVFRGGTEAPLA